MDGSAVSVRGLRKRYGERTAVDGIDFDIPHGEVLALLGPNGAGKTTTVEILEGYRRRDAAALRRLLPVPPGTPTRSPDTFRHRELAGSWELGRTGLVLSLWSVAAAVLALRWFRFQRRGDS